jgi:hypothetical protein
VTKETRSTSGYMFLFVQVQPIYAFLINLHRSERRESSFPNLQESASSSVYPSIQNSPPTS